VSGRKNRIEKLAAGECEIKTKDFRDRSRATSIGHKRSALGRIRLWEIFRDARLHGRQIRIASRPRLNVGANRDEMIQIDRAQQPRFKIWTKVSIPTGNASDPAVMLKSRT
jgi:hypothetical protein